MEQERTQTQLQQQERVQTPLKCPRCNSMDTKFRYFNNHSLAQPRHYCRACKRLWTVGGSQRDIPVGGNSRNKQTRASSSRCGDLSSQPQPPPLPSGEELQNSRYMTEMASMVPQTLDVTGIQPFTNLPPTIAPFSSFNFNNEYFNLDAINSLMQPQVMNQAVNVGNQVGGGGADMTVLQDWSSQSIAAQQDLPQQILGYQDQPNIGDLDMVELNHLYDQADSYHSSNYDLVQHTWPMSSVPQETMNNVSVSTSDACLWDNSIGNTTNTGMPTTLVKPNQWPNFPGYGLP